MPINFDGHFNRHLYGKKVKIIYFLKTIAAYDLKVGSYTELKVADSNFF